MGIYYYFFNKTLDLPSKAKFNGLNFISNFNYYDSDQMIDIFRQVVNSNQWNSSNEIVASPDSPTYPEYIYQNDTVSVKEYEDPDLAEEREEEFTEFEGHKLSDIFSMNDAELDKNIIFARYEIPQTLAEKRATLLYAYIKNKTLNEIEMGFFGKISYDNLVRAFQNSHNQYTFDNYVIRNNFHRSQ